MAEKKTEVTKKVVAPEKKDKKKVVEPVKAEKKPAAASRKKLTPNFVVEFMGRQTPYQRIYDLFVEEWKKTRDLADIKSLSIYYKVEENTAYCLVNEIDSFVIYV